MCSFYSKWVSRISVMWVNEADHFDHHNRILNVTLKNESTITCMTPKFSRLFPTLSKMKCETSIYLPTQTHNHSIKLISNLTISHPVLKMKRKWNSGSNQFHIQSTFLHFLSSFPLLSYVFPFPSYFIYSLKRSHFIIFKWRKTWHVLEHTWVLRSIFNKMSHQIRLPL